MKWTRRVEERLAHLLNNNPGARKNLNSLLQLPCNRHFLGTLVPLLQVCYSLINSSHCQGIHLDYSRNPASQVIQPIQQSQMMSRGQQLKGPETSYVVVDDQQPSTSRPLHHQPTKSFNPPSVASFTEESSHNISGLSSFYGNINSVMCYQ